MSQLNSPSPARARPASSPKTNNLHFIQPRSRQPEQRQDLEEVAGEDADERVERPDVGQMGTVSGTTTGPAGNSTGRSMQKALFRLGREHWNLRSP